MTVESFLLLTFEQYYDIRQKAVDRDERILILKERQLRHAAFLLKTEPTNKKINMLQWWAIKFDKIQNDCPVKKSTKERFEELKKRWR